MQTSEQTAAALTAALTAVLTVDPTADPTVDPLEQPGSPMMIHVGDGTYVPENEMTQELWLLALRKGLTMPSNVPLRFMNHEMLCLAIEQDPRQILRAPLKFNTKAVWTACLSRDISLLEFAPEMFVTEQTRALYRTKNNSSHGVTSVREENPSAIRKLFVSKKKVALEEKEMAI